MPQPRTQDRRRSGWSFPVGPLVLVRSRGHVGVRFDRRERPALMVGDVTLCSFLGHKGREIPRSLRKSPGLRFVCMRCGIHFG
jgi:hypothetical protein